METINTNLVLHLLIICSCSVLLAQALSPAGRIERTTKQQVLTAIPPSDHKTTPVGSEQLFLTSPSEKYQVFLVRRETLLGAGGFGSDFCYIQVQASGASVWESECTPVSNANTCSLVFSDAGLEIFDGSRSAWDGDVEDDDAHLETLELMDSGDMQIRNKEGELKWKASDSPLVNQNCGSLGAPGQSPVNPNFGSPIEDDKGPFGQDNQHQLGGGQQQITGGIAQQITGGIAQGQQQIGGFPQGQDQDVENLQQHQTPLVDNTPFDSSSSKVKGMGLVCLVGLMGFFLLG